MERLYNDLVQVHGPSAAGTIKQTLEKVDPRGLALLSDQDYAQFVNQFSNSLQQTKIAPEPIQDQAQYQSPQKRHIPINQKNMVYNEWAAIIQHQDEMDKALKLEEQKQNNIIKQKYMADLDQQRAGVARKQMEDRQMDA